MSIRYTSYLGCDLFYILERRVKYESGVGRKMQGTSLKGSRGMCARIWPLQPATSLQGRRAGFKAVRKAWAAGRGHEVRGTSRQPLHIRVEICIDFSSAHLYVGFASLTRPDLASPCAFGASRRPMSRPVILFFWQYFVCDSMGLI